MINTSTWAIKNPIPTVILFVLLTLVGIRSFNEMKIQQFPDIELPMVSVITTMQGAAPNQLETEVARILENSIASVEGIKHIYTDVSDGLVSIKVEFRLEKAVQVATEDVRNAVAKIRGNLPANADEPIVSKVEMASAPLLAYTISADDMDDEAMSWYVDNEINRALLSVRGVGGVNRVGGVDREIVVLIDPLKIQSLGTTVSDVSRQLANVQIEQSSGKAEVAGFEQPLRTIATLDSAEQFERLSISLSDGRRVRLGEIASVKDSYAKPKAAAFFNGEPVIGFEVSRSKGASDVEVGASVREVLKNLQQANPSLNITESYDFVTPVEEEFAGSIQLLYEGAILAVLVVWIFLRDFRATFIAGIALPLSAIPAFWGMHQLGFSINVVTLLSMSLVIGILVDDAIVEVENIVRHMRQGKKPYEASIEAAEEIGTAVVATTFSLIAVFLPTAFMVGIVGKFFKQFGWTASLAVFFSLVVARMLTPMMCAYLLRAPYEEKVDESSSRIKRFWNRLRQHPSEPKWIPAYLSIVTWTLKFRWITLLLAILFFAGSIYITKFIPSGFIPPDDNSQTQVYLELPPGSTLNQTIEASERARQMMMALDHVESIYTTIGAGSAGGDAFNPVSAETRKASLTIQLSPRGERPVKQSIERNMRDRLQYLPGVRAKVGLGGSGEKYQLVVSGSDSDLLLQASKEIERDLRTIDGLGNIESTAALVRTEINIFPDFERAAELGVHSAAIADTLRVATSGDYESMLNKLNLAERQIPVVVRLADHGFEDLAKLERLWVPGAHGPVMLGQVAKLEFSSGPAKIERFDRDRNITLNVELAGMPMGDVENTVAQLPSVKNLPAGVQILEVGDAEANAELAAGFQMAMITGVILIYVVLVLLFKSFAHPLTILMALPLSFGGAFGALLITEKMLSMPAFIGLIMLMGVATKNSILLVEYAIEAERNHKMSRFDAIMDACSKRARPIIMTSIAMSAGMLPVAAGFGVADTSFRAPMAVAVIGGLFTSTILSLMVIPSVYTLVDDARLLVIRGLKSLFNLKDTQRNVAKKV